MADSAEIVDCLTTGPSSLARHRRRMGKRRLTRSSALVTICGCAAAVILLLLGSLASAFGAAGDASVSATVTPQTSVGTDFWLSFEENYDGTATKYLAISAATAASGTVSIPSLTYQATFTVTPSAVTQIKLPAAVEDDTSDVVSALSVHIVTDNPVSVTGLSLKRRTSAGFLGIPTASLGTDYLIAAYKAWSLGSQFSVVATQDATTVTIKPSETVGTHLVGVPYTINLNQGQTYQLNDSSVAQGDLTGSEVSANLPIAVFAGDSCAQIPVGVFACDTLAEEMLPLTAWSTSFITEPFATRKADTFRVLAGSDATTVRINGAVVASLSKGKFFETTLSASSVITATQPISVMQYSQSGGTDNTASDPFDATVIPPSEYLNNYVVSTLPNGIDPVIQTEYANLVVPTVDIGNVLLDGVAIPAASFTSIAGTVWAGAQITLTSGSHDFAGPEGFGVTVYGYGQYDGYGYPAGFTFTASTTTPAEVSDSVIVPAVATSGIDSVNFSAVPTATAAVTSTVVATTEPKSGVDSLAFTGFDVLRYVVIGLIVTLAGVAIMMIRRRGILNS